MPTGTGSVAVSLHPAATGTETLLRTGTVAVHPVLHGTSQQRHTGTGTVGQTRQLAGVGGQVFTPRTIARCELWTDIVANGGTRLTTGGFVQAETLIGTESIDGTESLQLVIPGASDAASAVREGYVIRVWRSDTDFDEWAVGPLTKTRATGGRVEVTGQPLIYRLGSCGLVTEWQTDPVNGQPQLDVGVSGRTPTEIIQSYIVDHPVLSLQLPWLKVGQIDPTMALDLDWSSQTPLQLLRLIVDAVQATGELCELRLRRDGTAGYAIDLVTTIGSSATQVSLRLGRNLQSLNFKTDPTDRSTRIMPISATLAGFPTFLGYSRWRVVSVNSGAHTLVLEDPAGGSGPIGFDDQLNGWYLVRESTAESKLITDSVFSSQTLTLSAFITGLVAGEYVGFRLTEPGTGLQGSGNGLIPYYLDHPVYSAAISPGIGIKFGTIDRSEMVGVANLCPNSVMRTWTTPTAMPDGWTSFDVYSGIPASTFVGTFAQNTDVLYTQLGGKSLFFSAQSGTIVTPPVKFVPTYANQRVSVRISLLMTQWEAPGCTMRLALGIKLADGSIHTWLEDDRTIQVQPSNAKGAPWVPLAPGVWVDMVLNASDITVPSSGLAYQLPVTQADIDTLPTTAQGLVVLLNIYADTNGPPAGELVEGYLDGVMLTSSIEAPDTITEFGEANPLWQGTNTALGLLAPPQVTYAVSVVDLQRMNPS